MAKRIKVAFDPKGIVIPIDKIVPLREPRAAGKAGPVHRRIAASIKALGVIEPFIVYKQPGGSGTYLLLEGNVRLAILKELGETQVFCLLATEDEGYTYNSRVNHVSPIQEHFMILKTIESGVTEEQIAAALNINVVAIRQNRDLLQGITKEAVTILKGKRASTGALREMKRVRPMRQIEMAEMMVSVNNFSAAYAKCLLAATAPEQFVESEKPKKVTGMTAEQVARVERELSEVSKDFKRREESYGKSVIHLTFVGAYLRKLLNCAAVVRFLSQRHAGVLSEFQRTAETYDLEAAVSA